MSLGRKIKQWAVDHGRESAVQMVNEAVKTKTITRDQISLRDLAHATMGDDWETHLRRFAASSGEFIHSAESAADAVDPSTFVAITGNQLIDTVRENFNSPAFIGDKISTTIPVTNGNLEKQKEPWLSDVRIAEDAYTALDGQNQSVTQPGMPINAAGFLPNYVQLLEPIKYTGRCDVTFEMIYADRTRQAHMRAASVGKARGVEKELRILQCLAGLTNNFYFSYGGSAETNSTTYHVSAGTVGTWVNALDNRPLVDWTDVNAMEQIFANMQDPVTGQPIDVEANQLIVMPGNLHNAKHIIRATSIRMGAGGSTSTTGVVTYSDDDLKDYEIMTSKYLYRLVLNNLSNFKKQDGSTAVSTLTAAQATQMWFMGNFKQGLYYRQVYPLRVDTAPAMNPDDFGRDIPLSVRAMEFGRAGIRDPFQLGRAWGHNASDSGTPG